MHWTGNGKVNAFSVHSFDQCIGCSLTTICEWFYDNFSIWLGGKDAFFDCQSGFHGT